MSGFPKERIVYCHFEGMKGCSGGFLIGHSLEKPEWINGTLVGNAWRVPTQEELAERGVYLWDDDKNGWPLN